MAKEHEEKKDEFEISKTGLKVSYLRFLSDSAAGYVVLILIVAVLTQTKVITESFPDGSVKVAMLILLTIVATPLGLSIQGFSWVTLGWMTTLFELSCFLVSWRMNDRRWWKVYYEPRERPGRTFLSQKYQESRNAHPNSSRIRWYRDATREAFLALADSAIISRWWLPGLLLALSIGLVAWPYWWIGLAFFFVYPLFAAVSVWPTVIRNAVEESCAVFGITDNNWWTAHEIEELLEAHSQKLMASIEYVTGGMIFLRCMAFILFCLAAIRLLNIGPTAWNWDKSDPSYFFERIFVAAGISSVWISSVASYYRQAQSLSIAKAVFDESTTNPIYRVITERNLDRWNRSGEPLRWVADRQGRWDHAQWTELWNRIRNSGFWPLDRERAGNLLEDYKRQYP